MKIFGCLLLFSTWLIQVDMKTDLVIMVSETDCHSTIETEVQKFKETVGTCLCILDEVNTIPHDQCLTKFPEEPR